MPPTNAGEAVLHIYSRVAAVEAALRHVATKDGLNSVQNELRRDFAGMIDRSETHFGQMLQASDQRADKRVADLQAALEHVFDNRIPKAVKDEFEAEKKRDEEANKRIDARAKDSIRGVRMMMWALGPVGGGVVTLAIGWLYLSSKGIL